MDASHKSERKFPAYTTDQLRHAYSRASMEGDGARCEILMNEIGRREAGLSKPFVVPQITR